MDYNPLIDPLMDNNPLMDQLKKGLGSDIVFIYQTLYQNQDFLASLKVNDA